MSNTETIVTYRSVTRGSDRNFGTVFSCVFAYRTVAIAARLCAAPMGSNFGIVPRRKPVAAAAFVTAEQALVSLWPAVTSSIRY
jgi:hypothetical protein